MFFMSHVTPQSLLNITIEGVYILWVTRAHNAALRCERRLATLERSETAKRCESLLNALL